MGYCLDCKYSIYINNELFCKAKTDRVSKELSCMLFEYDLSDIDCNDCYYHRQELSHNCKKDKKKCFKYHSC